MKCFHCQATGVALYRMNEKGVEGIWGCAKCRDMAGVPKDPVVERIVSIIERARK